MKGIFDRINRLEKEIKYLRYQLKTLDELVNDSELKTNEKIKIIKIIGQKEFNLHKLYQGLIILEKE